MITTPFFLSLLATRQLFFLSLLPSDLLVIWMSITSAQTSEELGLGIGETTLQQHQT